jgi:hypothetical protein
MNIENISELAESIYWQVLSEFEVDRIGQGYIKLNDDGLGLTENTAKGQEFYFAIEGLIEESIGGSNE